MEVAKPDNGIDITFEAPVDLEIQPRKLSILHKIHKRFYVITLTPKEEGTFSLSVVVRGPDSIAFNIPQMRLIVVSDPSTTTVSYFERFDVMPGLLQPGCCQADTKITCSSGKDVTFTSTCSWERVVDVHHTSGIVFSRDSDFSIPLSVSSASIDDGAPTSFGVSEKDQNCDKCSSCSVYQPSANDILEFYKTEAIAKTFLNKTGVLFPKWLTIIPEPTTRSHSTSSHSILLSVALESKECQFLPSVKIQDSDHPTFAILSFHGSSEFTVSSDSININGRQRPFCLAVDLCSGSSSPIFISFPQPLDENLPLIKEFASRGWKINLFSIGLSHQKNLIFAGIDKEKESHLLLRGELELTAHLGATELFYKFTGEVGLEVENYSNVS